MSKTYKEIPFTTADDLWNALSPTNELLKPPCTLIFRGQGDASWGLLPSVLRKDSALVWGREMKACDQAFFEMRHLEVFCDYCDQIGVKIPDDSRIFRDEVLSYEKLDKYILGQELWPNAELDYVMAMAQHHGVQTRLLDWTKIPFVAAYFAASDALSRSADEECTHLAIWVLNVDVLRHCRDKVRYVKVPGSVSPHLSAQSGVFTLPLHDAFRDSEMKDAQGLEHSCGTTEESLLKLTLPIKESGRLFELSEMGGFSGARMFPSIDGAGKAVKGRLNLWLSEKK